MLDKIIEEFWERADLKKNHDDYVVSDDTQVGIEFCYEKMQTRITDLEQQLKQQWVSVDDIDHIEWIYARLVNHYNDSPSVDYISKFKSIIESLPKPPTK